MSADFYQAGYGEKLFPSVEAIGKNTTQKRWAWSRQSCWKGGLATAEDRTGQEKPPRRGMVQEVRQQWCPFKVVFWGLFLFLIRSFQLSASSSLFFFFLSFAKRFGGEQWICKENKPNQKRKCGDWSWGERGSAHCSTGYPVYWLEQAASGLQGY